MQLLPVAQRNPVELDGWPGHVIGMENKIPVSADFLRDVARLAAAESLPRFRSAGLVDNKLTSGFDPVTEADRETERAIRRLINDHFPDHGILGEEHGGENLSSRHIWIIDPIDGTRAFISGLPVWGTLVGLTRDGEAVAGFMSQPFTRELYLADGDSAHYEGPGGNRVLSTSRTTGLDDAIMFTTSPALYGNATRHRFDRLEASVRLCRYGVDCYAFAMVAAGYADLVVEPDLKPYDVVALIPIIEQAGGVITNWDGGPAEAGGHVVGAGTPELHAAALELLGKD